MDYPNDYLQEIDDDDFKLWCKDNFGELFIEYLTGDFLIKAKDIFKERYKEALRHSEIAYREKEDFLQGVR